MGSGARTFGMCGAHMSIADDATAASNNPGGLIQLKKPEISIVGAFAHQMESNTFDNYPNASGVQTISLDHLNYASATFPFHVFDCNMIVSINYQHLFDFTRQWDFSFQQQEQDLLANHNYHYDQKGKLSAIGLAYGIQINRILSLGMTLNFWEDFQGSNTWKELTHHNVHGQDAAGSFAYDILRVNTYEFNGFNVNLGMMWKINKTYTLSAILKTSFTANLKHERRTVYKVKLNDLPEKSFPGITKTNEKMDMPMVSGIGIACRFSDRLTIATDIYRTEWQDFLIKDAQGKEKSPVSGLDKNISDISETYQIRAGLEYLIIDPIQKYVIPLRCGLFYDPAPAEKSPDDFLGFGLGTGMAFGPYIFDIAYQCRFSRNTGRSILQSLGFSQDITSHSLYLSFIYHFK